MDMIDQEREFIRWKNGVVGVGVGMSSLGVPSTNIVISNI